MKPTPYKFIDTQTLCLKSNDQITEKTIQDLIVDNPSILGIGDYYCHDRERVQFRKGKLDILLKSTDTPNKRICAEIQLGKLDGDHLFRAWEYFLNEKDKYPAYELSSLLVCEEIDDRVLPVIRDLFVNKPFSILLMKAFTFEDKFGLNFLPIFNGIPLGLEEEDEQIYEKADRKYWLNRGKDLQLVDDVFKIVQSVIPQFKLNYNKAYIGLSDEYGSNNFIVFHPNKKGLTLKLKLPENDTNQSLVDDTSFTIMEYEKTWGQYRLKITKEKLSENEGKLLKLVELAYKNSL